MHMKTVIKSPTKPRKTPETHLFNLLLACDQKVDQPQHFALQLRRFGEFKSLDQFLKSDLFLLQTFVHSKRVQNVLPPLRRIDSNPRQQRRRHRLERRI